MASHAIPKVPQIGAGDTALGIRREQLAGQFQQHGALVGGVLLWRSLGYGTGETFRQARKTGKVPIQIFEIDGRRGGFAYTHELVDYLAGLGARGFSFASGQEARASGGEVE